MKYVICIPDGCADLPVPELDGRTPLEVADTPHMDALAARAVVGRAAVIPVGMAPSSDVGNMSILASTLPCSTRAVPPSKLRQWA